MLNNDILKYLYISLYLIISSEESRKWSIRISTYVRKNKKIDMKISY